MNRRVAILGIGIPGSGKTTMLVPYARQLQLAYISADVVRQELFGDASQQAGMEQVWQEVYQRVAQALATGCVVVDSTNAKQRDRRSLINHCRSSGAQYVVGLWFQASIEVCLKRNGQRERHVPQYAVERMAETLRMLPPSPRDEFDKLLILNTNTGSPVTIPNIL